MFRRGIRGANASAASLGAGRSPAAARSFPVPFPGRGAASSREPGRRVGARGSGSKVQSAPVFIDHLPPLPPDLQRVPNVNLLNDT